LVLAVDVIVLGCLADVTEHLEFAVGLLEFTVLLALAVNLVLLLLRLGVRLFGRHKV
jgi:hypothetical protein